MDDDWLLPGVLVCFAVAFVLLLAMSGAASSVRFTVEAYKDGWSCNDNGDPVKLCDAKSECNDYCEARRKETEAPCKPKQ